MMPQLRCRKSLDGRLDGGLELRLRIGCDRIGIGAKMEFMESVISGLEGE